MSSSPPFTASSTFPASRQRFSNGSVWGDLERRRRVRRVMSFLLLMSRVVWPVLPPPGGVGKPPLIRQESVHHRPAGVVGAVGDVPSPRPGSGVTGWSGINSWAPAGAHWPRGGCSRSHPTWQVLGGALLH